MNVNSALEVIKLLIFEKLMARKPKESLRAYKEWAPSVSMDICDKSTQYLLFGADFFIVTLSAKTPHL